MRVLRDRACAGALCLLALAGAGGDRPAIGSVVGELRFTDIRWLPRTLRDFGERRAYVLVATSVDCPLVQRYLPRLSALEREYRAQQVQFVAVNVAPGDSVLEMATQAVEHDADFPFVKDFDGSVVAELGFERTPEVVVLDAQRRLRYRGRIDDQYRLGGVRPAATRNDLRAALDDVLAGREVASAETPVDGCAIGGAPAPAGTPNYAEHVDPILRSHCLECHRPGGAAPFALGTYAQALKLSDMIAEVVEQQRMPPWYASRKHGPFVNERGLSPAERDTVLAWAASGAAPGDLSALPPLPDPPPSRWEIAEPDLVLRSPIEAQIPADGYVPYQYVVLPHVFAEDTWVEGVQVLAENPRVLHHANLGWVRLGEDFNEVKNFITGEVPGGDAMALDPGTACLLPKGSALALEVHYVTTGKPERDRISVGLRFPRVPVQRRLRNHQVADLRFRIPPGAPAHPVTAERVFEQDAVGLGLFVHMHLRGKDMTFRAHYPDGRGETLLLVPSYSFDWQQSYRWAPGARRFPRGTRIECLAHFDNSAFNPYNPDPGATVRFGLQTDQEMMYGFVFYVHEHEQLGIAVDPRTGQ